MIRKSGLAIFAALVILIFVVVYFLIGPLLRFSMVYTLEKLFQAETNIEKVSVSLSPLGITIAGLQITDKNQPSHNLISFDRANADLQLMPLLMGYHIVDELALQGLAYGAQRTSPGEVFTSEEQGSDDEENALEKLQEKFDVELPTADSVMAKMDLQLVTKGEALQTKIDEQQKSLQEIENKIPEKSEIEDIVAKIQNLKDSKIKDAADLKEKTKQLKELQAQLRQQRDQIKSVKEDISSGRKQLSEAVSEVKQAREEDWEKIKKVADLDNGGLGEISKLLIGDTWSSRLSTLYTFYSYIKPYIPSSDKDEEPEKVIPNRILPIKNKPYPNLLIKKTNINWLVGGGAVDLNITDLTYEHKFIDQPTRYKARASALPQLAQLDLQGDFSVRETLVSSNNWSIKGYKFNSIDGLQSLGLEIENGTLDSTGSLDLNNKSLDQQADVSLIGAKFVADDNKYAKKVADVLNEQQSIPFTVSADGTLASPGLSVNSPVDRIVGEALLGDVKKQADELQSQLKSDLNAKMQEQLQGNEQLLAAFNGRDKELDELDEIIEEALKAELKSLEDEAKNKLKDKLKDKLPSLGN